MSPSDVFPAGAPRYRTPEELDSFPTLGRNNLTPEELRMIPDNGTSITVLPGAFPGISNAQVAALAAAINPGGDRVATAQEWLEWLEHASERGRQDQPFVQGDRQARN